MKVRIFIPYDHNKLIVRFSFIYFFQNGAESLFFIFPDYTEIGDGWLKFIYISANHMYLVNREYFYIIPMYYEKKQMLCVIIRIALKEQL